MNYLARIILVDFTDVAPKHEIKMFHIYLCTTYRNYLCINDFNVLFIILIFFFCTHLFSCCRLSWWLRW